MITQKENGETNSKVRGGSAKTARQFMLNMTVTEELVGLR